MHNPPLDENGKQIVSRSEELTRTPPPPFTDVPSAALQQAATPAPTRSVPPFQASAHSPGADRSALEQQAHRGQADASAPSQPAIQPARWTVFFTPSPAATPFSPKQSSAQAASPAPTTGSPSVSVGPDADLPRPPLPPLPVDGAAAQPDNDQLHSAPSQLQLQATPHPTHQSQRTHTAVLRLLRELCPGAGDITTAELTPMRRDWDHLSVCRGWTPTPSTETTAPSYIIIAVRRHAGLHWVDCRHYDLKQEEVRLGRTLLFQQPTSEEILEATVVHLCHPSMMPPQPDHPFTIILNGRESRVQSAKWAAEGSCVTVPSAKFLWERSIFRPMARPVLEENLPPSSWCSVPWNLRHLNLSHLPQPPSSRFSTQERDALRHLDDSLQFRLHHVFENTHSFLNFEPNYAEYPDLPKDFVEVLQRHCRPLGRDFAGGQKFMCECAHDYRVMMERAATKVAMRLRYIVNDVGSMSAHRLHELIAEDAQDPAQAFFKRYFEEPIPDRFNVPELVVQWAVDSGQLFLFRTPDDLTGDMLLIAEPNEFRYCLRPPPDFAPVWASDATLAMDVAAAYRKIADAWLEHLVVYEGATAPSDELPSWLQESYDSIRPLGCRSLFSMLKEDVHQRFANSR